MKQRSISIALISLLLTLSGGCVYMLENPPEETWKARAQSQARVAHSGNTDAAPMELQDIDLVPKMTIRERQAAYAVVIGIEQYREKLPSAQYATRDAKTVSEYLTDVLGYPEQNVVLRLNEKAAKTDLEKYFGVWLKNNVEPNSSVFVYYSGHGVPNVKNGEAYLLPYDGDPTYVEATAYPIKKLYEELNRLPAREVVVMLDSCFSGAGGRSVVPKGSKPIGLSIENALLPPGKISVLAASAGNEISMAYEGKNHGLLTYYVLKGLQEGKFQNSDGTLKLKELFEYVKPQVQRVARKEYNTDQTPQLLFPFSHTER